MPPISVTMPGAGWGAGLNAFLDQYERTQGRTMAQGQNAALAYLRGLQIEGARRGLDKDQALDLLRQKIVEQAQTEIPLAAGRTMVQPGPVVPATPGMEGPGDVASIQAPPVMETLPGVTMQGRTMANLAGSLTDPRLKAALLTPQGQVAAEAGGLLTEEALRKRKAYAQARQESREMVHGARAAMEAGDPVAFSARMEAYHRRMAELLADAGDQQGAHQARQQAEVYIRDAVRLQTDKQETRRRAEDMKASLPLLRKLGDPGATPEDVWNALTFDWQSKDGQNINWASYREGFTKAVGRVMTADPAVGQFFQGMIAAMNDQKGDRDPKAAVAASLAKMGPAGPAFAARTAARADKLGEAFREWIFDSAKLTDFTLAENIVDEEDRTTRAVGGRPPGDRYARIGKHVKEIRQRPESPGVQARFDETAHARALSEARLELNAANRDLAEAEGKAWPRKSSPRFATYEQQVLQPKRARAERATRRHDAIQAEEDKARRGARPGAPPAPTAPPPAAGGAPVAPPPVVAPPPGRGAAPAVVPPAPGPAPRPGASGTSQKHRMAETMKAMALDPGGPYRRPYAQLTPEEKQAIYDEVVRLEERSPGAP